MYTFSNTVPATSEVIREGSELISFGPGGIFRNEKGWIYALTGIGIRQLSNPLDNPQNLDPLSKTNFLRFTEHVNLVNFMDS